MAHRFFSRLIFAPLFAPLRISIIRWSGGRVVGWSGHVRASWRSDSRALGCEAYLGQLSESTERATKKRSELLDQLEMELSIRGQCRAGGNRQCGHPAKRSAEQCLRPIRRSELLL
ncbi:hypothetical protein AN403_6205 [Pseudomonas fluorescens]|uniref:Uncharacterized protein n=1 Tax=Pseudomonas fluorescens TaxID=294 RepID=A0A0N8NY67_PSEFL|nr:hypothetical protein AN403_6205 [Pseudomonas fluorescens]